MHVFRPIPPLMCLGHRVTYETEFRDCGTCPRRVGPDRVAPCPTSQPSVPQAQPSAQVQNMAELVNGRV